MRRLTITTLLLASCCLPALPIEVRSEELPWAAIGQPYRAQIRPVLDDLCIKADVRYALVSGSLPRGIVLAGSGLEGTPSQMGHFRFVIQAANECVAVEKTIDLFVTGKPVLQVFPEELVFEFHAGGLPPMASAMLVTGTWPNLPYSVATGGTEWLHAEPASGLTPDTGSALSGDRVSVQVNPEKLAPGTYRAALVFWTWMGTNAPAIPVTLKVVKDE